MAPQDEQIRHLFRLIRARLTPKLAWSDFIWIVLPLAVTITMLAVIRDPEWLPDQGIWQWHRDPMPGPLAFLWPMASLLGLLIIAWIGHRLIDRSHEYWAFLLLPLLIWTGNWVQAHWFQFNVRGETPQVVAEWMVTPSMRVSIEEARSDEGTIDLLRKYEARVMAAGPKTRAKVTPPGEFMGFRGLYELHRYDPIWLTYAGLAAPVKLREGIGEVVTQAGWNEADRQVLEALGGLIWAGALATALVVFLILRLTQTTLLAWWSATLWLASPTIGLLFPQREAVWPFLACLILLLVLFSARIRMAIFAILAGAIWLPCVTTNLSFGLMLPLLGVATTIFVYRCENIGWIRLGLTVAGFGAGVALPLELLGYLWEMNPVPLLIENVTNFVVTHWDWNQILNGQLIADLKVGLITAGPGVLFLAILAIFNHFPWQDSEESASAGAVYWGWLLALVALGLTRSNLVGGSRGWLLLVPLVMVIAVATLNERRPRPVVSGILLLVQGFTSIWVLAMFKPLIGMTP